MPLGATDGVQYTIGGSIPSCDRFVMPGCTPFVITPQP